MYFSQPERSIKDYTDLFKFQPKCLLVHYAGILITCLPIMFKVMLATIATQHYYMPIAISYVL